MLVSLVSVAAAQPLVAVVVVDHEARREGYALQLEDLVVDDALPVDVAEGEQVAIVDPSGQRHPLDVAPGEAWEITGKGGEAWMSRLGEEVRTDILLVRGDPDSVEALAEALGAEVRVDGERIFVVGEDVLFDAPWADPKGIGGVEEVRFVRVEPESTGTVAVARPAATAVLPPRGTAAAPSPAAATIASVAPVVEVKAEGALPTRADEPVAAPTSESVSERRADARPELDPAAYVGFYFCGDGTPILLDPAGGFLVPGASGEWYVSAPGVVRLRTDTGVLGRAAIEVDRRYCRAVW